MHGLVYSAFCIIHLTLFIHAWMKVEKCVETGRYRRIPLDQRCNLWLAVLYSVTAIGG